jgi:hypothetical protein
LLEPDNPKTWLHDQLEPKIVPPEGTGLQGVEAGQPLDYAYYDALNERHYIPRDRVVDGINQTSLLLNGDGYGRRDYSQGLNSTHPGICGAWGCSQQGAA